MQSHSRTTTESSTAVKAVVTTLAVGHLAATVWHGVAHQRLAVALTPTQNAFVLSVILVVPIVAAALVWTRHVGIGIGLFSLSMLGSFLFGVLYHFVWVSADHVKHLPSGSAGDRSAFVASAGLLAFLELVSAIYGALSLLRRSNAKPPP